MNLLVIAAGFALSFGLIVAIGPQNAFVLRQGLRRSHVLAVTSVCFLSDGLLIAIGVGGAGTLFALNPLLRSVMTWIGILFIAGYGLFAFRSALHPQALDPEATGTPAGAGRTAKAAVLTALAFTWLNPHAYLDTLVLIGGVSAHYGSAAERLAFGLGALMGSAVWFYGLGFGAMRLAGFFESPRAWRGLDIAIGLVMSVIALSLAWHELA